MNPLQDVFISYGRADSYHFAKALNERLRAEGLEVWFDFDDIPLGVDYQKQIDDGIDKADNFLFIISPHSVNSAYCGLEIKRAIDRGKRIIPLLQVEEISRDTWQQRNPSGTDEQWETYKAAGKHSSHPNMHPIIQKINWVLFRETDDFDQSLAGLLQIFQHYPDYVRQHTELLNQALTWQQNKKQRKYLLAGESLQQAQNWLQIKFKDTQPPCCLTDLHCEYITESQKNAQNGQTQVFLACKKQDIEPMLEVRRFLQRDGLTVWSNQTDIRVGEDAKVAINEGLENADNIITLLSPEFLASREGRHELAYAASLNKRIIPVIIRSIDPTALTERIRKTLQSFQCIDITATDNPLIERLEHSRLLKQIRDDAAYVATHKKLLVQSLKWKRQNQNPCVLLQGHALSQAEAWLKTAEARKSLHPTAQQREFIQTSIQIPPIPGFDVFLSYSRENSDTAYKINDALQQQGKQTWFDQENIPEGTDFQEEIRRGIKASDNFVFILSPASIKSPYCKDEVEYAVSLNKRLVSILCREIDPSQLHPELAKIQWINFTQNDADFSTNFNQLVRTLDTDRDHVQAHTKCLQRALEWEENGRSDDLLLRGAELAIAEEWQQQSIAEKKQPPLTTLQTDLIAASRQKVNAEEARAKQRVAIMRQQLRATMAASLFAIIVLVISGSLGWLSFAWSRQNVKKIVQEWNEDISKYLDQSIKIGFQRISAFSHFAANDVNNGTLDINDLKDLQDYVWDRSKWMNDPVNNIYIGTQDGNFIGVSSSGVSSSGVSSNNGGKTLALVADPSNPIRRRYQLNNQGEFVPLLAKGVDHYHTRERPWYVKTIEVQDRDQTISSLYIDFPDSRSLSTTNSQSNTTGSNGHPVVLSLSQALYDPSDTLQGVAGADLYLSHIETLLSNAGGDNTRIFIVELSGDLVASYPQTPVILNDERIKAIDSENHLIRNAAAKLWPTSSDEISCTANSSPNRQKEDTIEIDRSTYFVQVNQLTDEINLDWCMVTLFAEEEVMEEIQKSHKLTTAILTVSLVLAIILGLYVYRTIRLSADFE